MNEKRAISVVILAAGQGKRMNNPDLPGTAVVVAPLGAAQQQDFDAHRGVANDDERGRGARLARGVALRS